MQAIQVFANQRVWFLAVLVRDRMSILAALFSNRVAVNFLLFIYLFILLLH